MNGISIFIMPIMVLFIIGYGVFKKINVYDAFIDGSKESFRMILNLFPTLLAMIFGVNILIKSNLIATVFSMFNPVLNYLKIPLEIIPMAIMRPISGSSSLAILNSIMATYGPDSLAGLTSSIIQGSTDTTFYVLTLYFGSVGIKKIRYAMWAGLFADLIGIVSAIIVASAFF